MPEVKIVIVVDLDLDGGKLVEYRCFRIPGLYPWEKSQNEVVVCFEAHPYFFKGLELNSSINNYSKYCNNFSVIGWRM